MKEINEKIQQEAEKRYSLKHPNLNSTYHYTFIAGAQYALQELSGKGAEGMSWDEIEHQAQEFAEDGGKFRHLTSSWFARYKYYLETHFTTPPQREGEFAEWVINQERKKLIYFIEDWNKWRIEKHAPYYTEDLVPTSELYKEFIKEKK